MRPGSRSNAPASARSRLTSPMAAISTRSSSRRRTTATWPISRRATSCASRRSCAGAQRAKYEFVHPENPTIRGRQPCHVDGQAEAPGGPCAQRRLLWREGDRPLSLRHRHLGAHGAAGGAGQAQGSATTSSTRASSAASSRGRVEGRAQGRQLRRPSCPAIEGWARMTGYNTIFIDDGDPYAHGFQLV